MLKKLTQAIGVAGYEKEVREIIKEEAKQYADEIITDALGNLIVLKKGTGANKKVIMCAGHMDEIGYQVTRIESDGRLGVRGLGGLSNMVIYHNRVRFRDGRIGVVSCTTKVEESKNEVGKLYIDIGCTSKEDAEKYVKIGDVCGFCGEYVELANRYVTSKSLDDRFGCYVMLEALKRNKDCYNDVYYVFTVQEEVGCRGAIVAAERIKPDIGIALDVTTAFDYPNSGEGSNKVGKGTCIKISDGSVICDEYLVEEMVKCAEENQIKYQRDIIIAGGTDAGPINRAYYGARCAGISVATRYVHSPCSVVSLDDVDASTELLHNYTNREFTFAE